MTICSTLTECYQTYDYDIVFFFYYEVSRHGEQILNNDTLKDLIVKITLEDISNSTD